MADHGEQFLAVRGVETALRALGVVLLALGAIGSIVAIVLSITGDLTMDTSWQQAVAIAGPATIGAVYGVAFFFLAGLLRILLAIERNTRQR